MLDTLMGMAPASASSSWDPLDDRWYGNVVRPTNSGIEVSEESAMTFTTVYACVAKIARTVATLPISVVDTSKPNERHPVDHEIATIFNGRANDEATGLTVRETIIANLALWGMGYAEVISSNDRQTVKALIPLMSRDMTPKRTSAGSLYYEHNPQDGEKRNLSPANVLAIPGLSLNGVTGLSPIGYNREAIGLGQAATMFGGSFFKNGAWAGGFIQRDPDKDTGAKLSREGGEQMLDDMTRRLQGADKAFGIALLREGMTFKQVVSMPMKDAQFVEIRKLQDRDVYRIFDMPPVMMQDMEFGTYSNTEQQDLAFAKHTILPWVIRVEAAIKAHFFPDEPLALKHNMAGLMRGDVQARYGAYATARQWGWLSINDIRQLEDMNPIEHGDEYLTPLNMAVVGEPRPDMTPAGNEPPADNGKVEDRSVAIADAFVPLAKDAAARIAAKETKALENAFKRRAKDGAVESFSKWLDKFYGEHVAFVCGCLEPVVRSFETAAGYSVTPDAHAMAETHASVQYDMIRAMLDTPTDIPEMITTWKSSLPQAIADGLLDTFRKSIQGENDG